tara:strand:- start:47777 stop:48040 length:264 start_codon:yes stop_codon:yes gene_type:complete
MGWWQNAGNTQQFFNATLPQIVSVVDTLSKNIGRLAMATEENNNLRKNNPSLGGDMKYLKELVERYGSQAKMVDVIKKEEARRAKGA